MQFASESFIHAKIGFVPTSIEQERSNSAVRDYDPFRIWTAAGRSIDPPLPAGYVYCHKKFEDLN